MPLREHLMRARALGLVVLILVCGPRPGVAQTRFEWPDTAVNMARYTRVEECDAAVRRAERSADTHEALMTGVWRDTMPPPQPQEVMKPTPAPVVATARACLQQRFAAADSVPLTDFGLLLPLYLLADWEMQAQTLVERRLGVIASKDQDELLAVLDTVITVYMGREAGRSALPPRFALAEELVREYLPQVTDRLERLRLSLTLARVMIGKRSIWEIDPERFTRWGAWVVAIMDSLTPGEWARFKEEQNIFVNEDKDVGTHLAATMFAMRDIVLGKQAVLDSLRRSTAAYLKLMRETFERLSGGMGGTWNTPIGERAPRLEGSVWLGRSDSTTSRPTPGRVSLVVFLAHQNCGRRVYTEGDDMYAACAGQLVPLRRLQDRFPMLEITIVTETHGYWAYVKDSLTAAREAELTKRWLESYGLRAALTLTDTEFWRLPNPDGRRVTREIPNFSHYSFGKILPPHNGTAFLIDQDGVIIEANGIARNSEGYFAELIEALLAREVARS